MTAPKKPQRMPSITVNMPNQKEGDHLSANKSRKSREGVVMGFLLLLSVMLVLQENSLIMTDPPNQNDLPLVPGSHNTAQRMLKVEDASKAIISQQKKDKKKHETGPGYLSEEELRSRSERFPSVEERVKLYMSDWYIPPCEGSPEASVHYSVVEENSTDAAESPKKLLLREVRTVREGENGKLRTFHVEESTDFNLLHYATPARRDHMHDCKHNYCRDTVKYLFPAVDRILREKNGGDGNDDMPILYQFSDVEKSRAHVPELGRPGPYPNIPHMKKFRFALPKEERERVTDTSAMECVSGPRAVPKTLVGLKDGTADDSRRAFMQPIVFKLKVQRHYGHLKKIPSLDIPWPEKKNVAIFRGTLTGEPRDSSNNNVRVNNEQLAQLSDEKQCDTLIRCKLVYSSAKSQLVDAKLSLPILDARKNFPQIINGVELYGEMVSLEDMLKYKALIMLEGNDVSSGLKWALYSSSVVMMQTPTKTSWAMEELLEPWVHFVPLNDDLSDVEEKMQWVIDNDAEAQNIAHRGSLWIKDLVYHPDVEKDEFEIFDEILRRYAAHFSRNLELTS
jgi:hypothetical protein